MCTYIYVCVCVRTSAATVALHQPVAVTNKLFCHFHVHSCNWLFVCNDVEEDGSDFYTTTYSSLHDLTV